MFAARTVIHRYTPPTCTLEISAQSSPLSLWVQRPVLRELAFLLRFDDPRLPEEEQVTIRGNATQLESLWEAVSVYVQSLLVAPPHLPLLFNGVAAGLPEPDKLPDTLTVLPTAPRLEARGLLVHGLFLGSLAAAGSVPTIDLSASQLFDLANALDEYHNDLVVLPEQFAPVRPLGTRAIAGIAAALVAAVGATYASRQLFAPPDPQIASESLEPSPSPNASQREPGVDLPAPPPVTVVPNPKLDSPLASGKPLPPPPAVEIPSGDGQNLPAIQAKPVLPELPDLAIAPPNASANPEAIASLPLPPSPQVKRHPEIATATAPPKPNSLQPGFAIANQGNPQLPALPPLAASPTPLAANPDPGVSDKAAEEPLPVAETGSAAPVTPENRLAARPIQPIPQIAEAKTYFEQRWRPEATLTQALEYRLEVKQDGSIGRIIPVGRPAELHLDRTGMPLMGEAFVSPLTGTQTLRLRVVFNPNGTVQAFSE